MPDAGAVVVVGGTRAIGFGLARHYVEAGRDVVLTGRDPDHVDAAVRELGGRAKGLVFDLAEPRGIAPALAGIGRVARVALVAIDRDTNKVAEYDIEKAIRLVTLKLVGYTAVVHALVERLETSSSLLQFGRMAKERPYPG